MNPGLLGGLLYLWTRPVTKTEGEYFSCQVMPGAFNLFEKLIQFFFGQIVFGFVGIGHRFGRDCAGDKRSPAHPSKITKATYHMHLRTVKFLDNDSKNYQFILTTLLCRIYGHKILEGVKR